MDEVNILSFGTRKDFTELVLKSGDDKIHIYLCPKPFQDEMGITFTKGDEIAVTGSKVQQDASDIILGARARKGHRHPHVPRRQRQPGVGLAHRQVTASRKDGIR